MISFAAVIARPFICLSIAHGCTRGCCTDPKRKTEVKAKRGFTTSVFCFKLIVGSPEGCAERHPAAGLRAGACRCAWLKYSEWVWTISANTTDYFAGYNQFQNLTVGGKTRSGQDGTNAVTFMAMKATEECKTHQPGLSVRVQADCPRDFMDAVTHLVSTGTAFRVGAAGRAGIRDRGHFL